MRVVRSLHDLERNPSTVLTIGTFDGLHRGHQKIIEEVLNVSRKEKRQSTLVTFDPHPREVIRNNNDRIQLLTTIEERVGLLETMGVDVCLILPFTRDLSLLPAADFFRTVLLDRTGAGHIIVGFDFAFGKGRSGNVIELQKLGDEHGIGVTIVPRLADGEEKISSSAVRRAIAAGDIGRANRFLGRDFSFSGIVQRGDGLGSKLGFPTANIRLESNRKLLPSNGVYAVSVHLDGKVYHGMMNIGNRPTVTNQSGISVEVHIFEFSQNIYGAPIGVHVHHRLRNETKFENADALVQQLQKDRTRVLELISELKIISTCN